MQEIYICAAASERDLASAVTAELARFDALEVNLEQCDDGELPLACEAAAEAAGVVLLLSPAAVPAEATRAAWAPVLDRLERAPRSLFCLFLDPATRWPALLRPHVHPAAEAGSWAPALRRWAARLGYTAAETRSFEPVGFDEQYEFRDVVWIPCAGRDPVSVEEDLTHALDGRRVLVLLDGFPPDLPLPPATREVIRRVDGPPVAEQSEELRAVPSIIATCYADFLHRDFCAKLADVEPSALTACLTPVTRDGRILRIPPRARRLLAPDAAPRRRHFELLSEYLASPDARDHLLLVRLELPAALAWAFATDWNSAAGLTWRAYSVLRDDYPKEAAAYLLRLRRSAVEHAVHSWVQLCERELRWLGVEPPPVAPPEKKRSRADTRQMKLDW